jgi:hypothetical protein
MPPVVYGNGAETTPAELAEFYARLHHQLHPTAAHIERMLANSAVAVTAREDDGRLIGLARGISDGLRGYLTECKLDPAFQGPGAVTRTDGRVEHDTGGIAGEMARRALEKMFADGVLRVDVLAWGTEVDFVEELGFRRSGGLVGLTLMAADWAAGRSAASSRAAGG